MQWLRNNPFPFVDLRPFDPHGQRRECRGSIRQAGRASAQAGLSTAASAQPTVRTVGGCVTVTPTLETVHSGPYRPLGQHRKCFLARAVETPAPQNKHESSPLL